MNQRPNLPKNPLRRDGVSHGQRLTLALSPGVNAAQVDERGLADFLVLAYQLSEQVRYYSLPSSNAAAVSTSDASTDEHWQDFFGFYTPVQIALISKTKTQPIKQEYDTLLEAFLGVRNGDDLKRIPELNHILEFWKKKILQPIQTWYDDLESYTPLRSIIKGLVNTNLTEAIIQILSFERTYGSGEIDFYSHFIDTFGLTITTEQINTPPLAPSLFSPTIRDDLDGIFQSLFQVYRQIIGQAPDYLEASLRDRRDHPPHLAMYVAMLDVLQPARDDLNRMTQRHLDFFYRKVLALPARPATPDYAHLLFELVKPQREYRLAAGTRFKAGKDATGTELFYALDQDVVVHKATIASLKGLFLESAEFPEDIPTNIKRLLTSPVANSADGLGGEFPKEQAVKAWLPFGGPRVATSQTAQLDIAQTPQGIPAQLGVAIASDVLLLQEGERTITLMLTLETVFESPEGLELEQAFEVYLSGEKDWILAQAKTPSADDLPAYIDSVTWNQENSTLEIVVKLTAEVDPVLPYDPSSPIPFDPDTPNLPLTLERPMPVLRLQLTTSSLDDQGRSVYHYFRSATLNDITVTVKVPEVRNLVVQTDAGVQDVTKPFQPFGPRPKAGATLYVGSQEIFQKPLSRLTINLEWDELPEAGNFVKHYRGYYLESECVVENTNDSCKYEALGYFENFAATISRRTKRTWSNDGILNSYNLFKPLGERTLVERNAPQEPLPGESLEPFTTFAPQTSGGFLRFVLDRSFLHDEFANKLAIQTLATAKNFQANEFVNDAVYEVSSPPTPRRYKLSEAADFPKNSSDPPATVIPVTIKEPYTPVIRTLSLGYEAQAKLTDVKLFRLHPFGGFDCWSDQGNLPLFPQFTHEGELLIGIANLDPPTALPLLFQVAEETADTGLRRTEAFKPLWFYLKDNTWVPLSDRISADTTNGLIRSGIVNLGIPEDISNASTTILDPTFHWVKVTMPARTRTVCHIIGVHPQAARVTFADAGNDPNHLAMPLPAGTIAKLEKPQAAVKGIEQPYPSVEGRVQEPPNQFYTRVSEHLRHKGRAVTIFDYERLVLEKFPDVYKVRCLNHGQFDDATNELFELAPGAVTLAVIPDLSQRATIDDLQPKVNINRLQAIETYLSSLSSSWATIKVVNPQYEPIRVSFEVKFLSPYDANFGYYRRELDRAIVGFLTPWTVDQGADIHFGGKVYRSAILNFVEEQEYVDYVVNFEMSHNGQDNVQGATASTARSVLTSVPPELPGHGITEHQEQVTSLPKMSSAAGILGYEPLDSLVLGTDDSEELGNE